MISRMTRPAPSPPSPGSPRPPSDETLPRSAAPAAGLRHLLAGALVVAATFAVAAPATAQVEVRRVEQQFFLGDALRVELDLSIGELVVEGTDRDRVEVELVLTCRRDDLEKCRERANRIRLEPRVSKRIFSLALRRTPREKLFGIDAKMTVRIPSTQELEVDLRSGDVMVRGMRWNMEIDAGEGDVDVAHRHDLVGRVSIAVGFGSADLWISDGRIEGRGFPKSVKWNGPGQARIEIDAGGGNAVVRLE